MGIQNFINEQLHVKAKVSIDGEPVNFASLELEQEYGQHHRFSIRLDYDTFGKSFMQNPKEQMEMLGQIVRINFQHGEVLSNSYLFRGIVTRIRVTGEEGRHGYLVVEGASSTVALDRGRRTDIYSDMSLHGIFEDIHNGTHHEYLKMVNNPIFENRIDFAMQCEETDWEFMQRLAYQYGENLFYSGYELLIGDYREWDPTELMYDREITNLEFCSRLLPNEFTTYLYQPDNDSTLKKEAPEDIENASTYVKKAAERGHYLTMYKTPQVQIDAPVGDPMELAEMTKRKKTRTAAQTVYVAGKAKTFEPYIGRLITIMMPEGMGGVQELGTYRVIKSIHRIDQNLRYHNEFEAVPAKLKTMPVKEPRIPTAGPIMGIVLSNADPNGQGRVKVDFPFAMHHSKNWLRVMTPGAGSSEEVGTNRGFVFIPEEGDQVMVGFEYGDPNRPYVMGSMFHGRNGKGGGSENHLKSIKTRSGHSIEFNDSEDALGITITDKRGNMIQLDTKGKNIHISTPELMTLKAKNMEICVDENLKLSVGRDVISEIGNNMQTKVGATIENSANEYKEEIKANSKSTIGDKFEIVATEVSIVAENGDLILKSAGVALLEGTEDARISKG